MNNVIIRRECRSEWPVGAILKVRNTIPDKSFVGATVTILGSLQNVLGQQVQAVDIHGVEPPFPQPYFLARPIDLFDFSNGAYDCFEETLFRFNPTLRVWVAPHEQSEKA